MARVIRDSMEEIVATVYAGAHERRWCPVWADVSREEASRLGGSCVAVDEYGLEYPVQLEPVGERLRAWWILPALSRGQAKRFTLKPLEPAAARDQAAAQKRGVHFTDRAEEAVDVEIGGALFTSYQYAAAWARPFLYPVVGPGGAWVTRSYPMRDDIKTERRDHPHHKSIYFTHGDVNGVDNWSEQPGHGRTRHQRFTKMEPGPVFGDLASHNLWVDKDDRPILEQAISLRFYALPGHVRLFDAAVTFHATYGDVVFGDTKEGGLLSVRVTSTMDASGAGRIETATGAQGESESWGRPAAWCHYSGPVQTPAGPVIAGIGVLDHPTNPRHPTHWHVRDYGLMTANPFGLSYYYKDKSRDGSLRLPAGERITFRYRVVVHEGDAAEGRIREHYAAFAYPPAVKVEQPQRAAN